MAASGRSRRDEAIFVERLAEVHVPAAAPCAERGVTGGAHRVEVCQLGRSSACTWTRRAQARLDGAVDEPAPAVGQIRAREHESALGLPHGGVVPRIPARPVDRPGAACELVGQPVVGGRIDDLEPGRELVERALHGRAVVGVDRGRVAAEADEQLAAIREQSVGHQIAEGMAGLDGVDATRAPLDPQPQLDAAGRLTEGDGLALGGREAVVESDVRKHVERDGQDARACPQDVAVAGAAPRRRRSRARPRRTGVESHCANGACTAIASIRPRVPAPNVKTPPVSWVSSR